MAKGVRTMGMPGIEGNLIGQSPIGYAFPTGAEYPVMLDICLAYAAGESLAMRAERNQPVPTWWGVGKDGSATTDAWNLLAGTKYPIGEHKGFGLALLAELLTGVFSMGAILDEGEEDGPMYSGTSHTAIAIRTDALMPEKTYLQRSSELIRRLKAQSDKVRIPGETSFQNTENYNHAGYIDLEDDVVRRLNRYADEYGVRGLGLVNAPLAYGYLPLYNCCNVRAQLQLMEWNCRR
jgi:LDH2 family malate/lactate/ureidoglycolate dehydrogenase